MRCPKCGFISFDHLATCLNCSKDISEMSSAAHGTTYNAIAPLFLKFTKSDVPKDNAVKLKTGPDNLADDLDLVDPDLDILINDEKEEGIEFNSDDLDMSLKDEFGGSGDRNGFDIALDEEEPDGKSDDSEPAVDLSQFEDMTPGAGSSEAAEEKFTMNLPDELADISDLAPPSPPQKQRSATQENRSLDDGMDFDMLDMDLKLDGIDAGFSLTSPGGREEGVGSLSLDDIDLSSPLEKEKSAPPAPRQVPKPASAVKSGEMDMDADLDFSLDLGGLTIPKK